MISRVVQVYPGSSKFLQETIASLSGISTGVIITCAIVVLWAGSWVFAVVSLLVTFSLFAIVYKFMPNAYVSVRDTIPGAVIGGLLWEASKYGFAWSLNYFHYDQIYGSVGAVVAVLTWSYVSSLVLLFGAQLTGVFHREHIDHSIVPNAPVPSASYS